ncbi:MAG TPA: TRAP transporter TatT component family protein [Deltaproteobacteria bacterium]|nr:TRAP transporter TatT component family protein [Deltaproteobacteria bacterium]HOM28662.1 TRAP transporter TatT component family protein [Deltaproteobacteria bacterium]HPP80590.1 TRAP transporter TatT component family protein [Deltaproteobacteria bacterium]
MAWGKGSRPLSILVGLMAIILAGCSMKALTIRSMEPIMRDMDLAVNRSTDVEMLKDALPAFLVQMDGLILASESPSLLLKAAEANFGYANAFLEDTDKPRASALYLKARDYAARALYGTGPHEKALEEPLEAFTKTLGRFTRPDVPALFWTANCWLAWGALNLDRSEAVMDMPKAQAMLERVIELDETFFYGAAHAALGAIHAAKGGLVRGSLERAKEHFDKAFAISQGRLQFIPLYYAQYYAYQTQDRDLFVSTLEGILARRPDAYPDKAFVNEVARRKAKVLLENVDMYF